MRGKKTYLTGFVIVALLALQWADLISMPTEAYGALFALGLIFLRSGVSGDNTSPPQKTGVLPLLIVTGLIGLGPGCAHTPEAEAFLTLKHTKTAVIEAMDIYTLELALGRVDSETEARIDQAYLDFSAAFKTAVKVASFDYQATTPEAVRAMALELLELIDQVTNGP